MMKLVCVVALIYCAFPISSEAARCGYEQNLLDDINDLLNEQIAYHRLSVSRLGYFDKADYVIKHLNSRIYQQGRGSDCKNLDEVIVESSKKHSVEIEGLDSSLARLKRLLDHLDARNNHHKLEIEKYSDLQDICEEDKNQIQLKLNNLNQTAIDLEKKIVNQTAVINALKEENKKLQSKVNKNSPAIHGETGVITGTTTTSTIINADETIADLIITTTMASSSVVVDPSENVTPFIDVRVQVES
ncbi:uncharacterized protein LOC131692890 [Topomyia yanbarensis]|uniref:uncharacterized protein LOC131692890 n=1 Tax=Topomyia yanbarensis TaxID=2498891 RepID=UPI00273B4006|nr:uncharacterized protein LOC131692890 [Topomyia yanbarensis]